MKSIGYVGYCPDRGFAVSSVGSLRGARTRATVTSGYPGYGVCTVHEVFIGGPIAKGDTVGAEPRPGTPQAIVDLYEVAQINEDMDNGTYVGGTDHYGIARVLEALAEDCGWNLPEPMNLGARKAWLRERGREGEIEYLGVNGG